MLINSRCLLFTVLEAGKSEVKAPTWSHSGEGPFLGSQLVPSGCVLTWWQGLGSLWSFFYKAVDLFLHCIRKWQPTPVFLPGESQGRGSLVGCRLWGAQSWTRLKQLSSSSRPISEGRKHLPKVPLTNTIISNIRISTYEFWRGHKDLDHSSCKDNCKYSWGFFCHLNILLYIYLH